MIRFDASRFDVDVFDLYPGPVPEFARIVFSEDAIQAQSRTTERGQSNYGIPSDGYK